MTPPEIVTDAVIDAAIAAEDAAMEPPGYSDRSCMRAAITSALELLRPVIERETIERCAKVCDERLGKLFHEGTYECEVKAADQEARGIARAIRALSALTPASNTP